MLAKLGAASQLGIHETTLAWGSSIVLLQDSGNNSGDFVTIATSDRSVASYDFGQPDRGALARWFLRRRAEFPAN
jgi:hypothetical protein